MNATRASPQRGGAPVVGPLRVRRLYRLFGCVWFVSIDRSGHLPVADSIPHHRLSSLLCFLSDSTVLAPGAQPPVDFLPILKYVPERWAPWKTLYKEVRKVQRKLYFGLLTECERARVKRGEENSSYMEEVVKRQEEFEMTRDHVGYVLHLLLFVNPYSFNDLVTLVALSRKVVQIQVLLSSSLLFLC